MKKTSLYIASIALAAAGFAACDNDFERPPMVVPTSSWQANTTIEQFKADYWSTVQGTPQTVGLNADGDSIIVKGRVCSSDESGNIFKYLFVQGESEALAFSLDFYDIYQSYKYGQEIYVNLTGLTIGGYSGLMCVGSGSDANGRVARAPEALFATHAEVSGLPSAAKVDTVLATIPEVNALNTSAEGLQKWQSQLVRFDGVRFENAGQPFAVGTSSNSRYIVDAAGNRINVYNSTYADFKDELLPSGEGSVVGILSYFGTNWQILLNDAAGCIGFEGSDTPVTPPTPSEGDGDGTEAKPYTTAQVIAMNPTSTTDAVKSDVWVSGYIVGYMPTEPSTLLSGTVFGTTGTVPTTNLVIASAPDVTDYTKCVGIQLPSASVTPGLRDALNLQSHPENLGKLLSIKGDVMYYCKGPGVKNASAWTLEGQDSPVTPPAPADGETVFSETFLNGDLGQFGVSVETSGSWTGWRANTKEPLCAIANSYVNSKNEAATAWLFSPAIDLTAYKSAAIVFEQAYGFYFPTKQEEFCTVLVRESGNDNEWQPLTLTVFPEKSGSGNWTGWVENSLDITSLAGKTIEIAFRYVNDGKQSIAWEIKNLKVTAAK